MIAEIAIAVWAPFFVIASQRVRPDDKLGKAIQRRLAQEAGVLRRLACHRAGHFGPDPLALAMTRVTVAARGVNRPEAQSATFDVTPGRKATRANV